MKKGLLSVLIPAYNPPHDCLGRILDSLKAQMKQHPDVEIIVVDDGSVDDLSWVKNYPHCVYIRNEWTGECHTRNTLLDAADGEYIAFIDADDEIYDNYLSVIIGNMREGCDWVSYDWECDRHKEWALQNIGQLMINCAVWAYSFRADFIGDMRFDESYRTGGDQEWLGRLLRDDCKHKHDHSIFYNYRWMGNEMSMCHRQQRGEKV